MAKKEMPKELQLLAQWSVDQAYEVVVNIEEAFHGLKTTGEEKARIAKAIYEVLDSAFTRAAKE